MPSTDTKKSFCELIRQWLSKPELLPSSLDKVDYSDFCFWLSLEDHVSELHDLQCRVGDGKLHRWFSEEVANRIGS